MSLARWVGVAEVVRGFFLWRTSPLGADAWPLGWEERGRAEGLGSGRSTLICLEGLRGVAEGERAFWDDTKGIFEEERRPMRAWSWGSPSVKASLAGVIMSCAPLPLAYAGVVDQEEG